ncbi:CmpA/NrtA family ABC transporter substrate-binding protein [Aureimonas ureilytica]|uniref:CmpA/NrtA family ABC transporter substrate-binding protein n=1 Tax=Aureimonas ureilytica TaxID=401562 RepID=UPI00035F590E|nr:CmpA/NrtA family ABC transporter substrate-binding protein [Aureimonas ureilytica]
MNSTPSLSAPSTLSGPATLSNLSTLPTVRLGFIPLVDAAVPIAAAALGLDRAAGLRLDLVRDVSWSNIRDRLAFRQFDAAHLLGPMAVASQLGLGSNPYPVIAPFSLGLGGNAVTLSMRLFEAMREAADGEDGEEPAAHARALARVVRQRAAAGEAPLTFAMTYPFSSHNYEFRFWMAEAGIDPDRDVAMTVVPPPLTVDALRSGAIDGFCVNAPWNVGAVEAGVGRIVAVKADISPSSPEKVLGVRPDWWAENAELGAALLRALRQAALWCDGAENRVELASILARPEHLGGDAASLASILAGDLRVDRDGTRRNLPNYLTFHRGEANRPRPSEALWVYSQMVRWGQVPLGEDMARRAAGAFRPDLHDAAFEDAASGDSRETAPVGELTPDAIKAYVEGFPIRRQLGDGAFAPSRD